MPEVKDEITLLAEEIDQEYWREGPGRLAFTHLDVVEAVLRRRLVPATAYSLPLGQLILKDKKGTNP